MSLSSVFDKLGQTVLPKITAKVFPDTMHIIESVGTSDGAGGFVKSTDNEYREIPCTYEPVVQNRDNNLVRSDVPISSQQYLVTCATHIDGERINLDPRKHRLKVLARGNQPDKYFRLMQVRDSSGVIFECLCEREN